MDDLSFQISMIELIQKYFSETLKKELSLTEIATKPQWEKVWHWWKALEYYEGRELPMSIEECKNKYGE